MLPLFFIAILIAVLQLTAVPYARIGPSTFNLDIIALVFFSLKYGMKAGMALGLFFGILNGVFSTNSFWLNVVLYTAIGSLIGHIGRWFYKETLFTFLLMVFASLVLIYFLNTPASFFRLFLSSAMYNIAISIFLFYFLKELKV